MASTCSSFANKLLICKALLNRFELARDFRDVVTLAHIYAIPPELLGFNVGPANLPPWAQQVEQPADEMQAEVEAPEAPVEVETGEARPEDCAVEAPVERDADIVDDGQLSMSSSLVNIRIGCESLGL